MTKNLAPGVSYDPGSDALIVSWEDVDVYEDPKTSVIFLRVRLFNTPNPPIVGIRIPDIKTLLAKEFEEEIEKRVCKRMEERKSWDGFQEGMGS